MKRFIFSSIFSLFFLCISFPSFSEDYIISPSEGTWANYQSLVLDLPYNYQAYYSLAGENPLEFGLIYDEPVVLENEGETEIKIVIVDEEHNVVSDETLNYTVDLQEKLDFVLQDDLAPVIEINQENSFFIPEDVQYSLNNNDTFVSGKYLTISEKMYFERYIPIILGKNNIPYRYILKLGNSNANDNTFEKSESLIEIDNWNYITFSNLKDVSYSINNEPFMHTNTGSIYIDRSEDVHLEWKQTSTNSNTELFSVFLPKKPEILGIPTVPIVNKSISFYLSDSRFVFGKELNEDAVLGIGHVFIDTIYGDAFSFFENIPIYYNGIKQGELQASFIIDKIPPQNPIVSSVNDEVYSRDSITISIDSNDPVLFYVPDPKTSKTGFVSYEFKNKSPVEQVNVNQFSSLESNTITLTNSSTNAQSYEIFAYSKDYAGNASEIVSLKVVIDPYNYYIKQDFKSVNDNPLGTIDDPFTDLSQIESILNTQNFQNFYLDGVFEDLNSIDLHSHTAFFCTDSTRLIFKYGETLSVKDSLLSIQGGTLEQSTSNHAISTKNTFIDSINSIVSIENCEIILTGGKNNNCISLDESSLYIYNSGLTVQSIDYASGVLANNSSIMSDSLRTILVADTAIPLSLVNSTCGIENSAFISNAQYSRSIELINSEFSLINNTFVFDFTNQKQKNHIPAIWFDSQSILKKDTQNTFAGFTSLY